MRFRILAGLSLAAALAAPSTSSAQLVGTTTTLESFTNFGNPLNVGYLFNVTNPFQVTHLAFWDQGDNGLLRNHSIGLWSPTGQLLSTAIVLAGTGGQLVDGHRLVAVTPFILQPGVGYRVGGTTGEPELWAYDGVLANAPGIQWTAGAWCDGNALQDVGSITDPDCGSDPTQTGYFGGNFAGNVVATPEPASMALVATGLLGVFGVARRRRNKAA